MVEFESRAIAARVQQLVRRGVEKKMPIQIQRYFATAQDIWQQEKSGRRVVARCTNKAIAARIVKLLNIQLELRPKKIRST